MFKNISIRTKLTSLIIFLVIITVITSGYISYSIRKSLLEENYLNNLQALADMKADKINAFVDKARDDIHIISNLDDVKNYLSSFAPAADSDTSAEKADLKNITQTKSTTVDEGLLHNDLADFTKTFGAQNIYITNTNGKILLSSNDVFQIDNIRQSVGGYDDSIAVNALKCIYFSRIFKEGQKFFITAGAPISTTGNKPNGLVFVKLDLTDIYDMLSENLKFGNTTETILAQKSKNRAVILNPLKTDPKAALVRGVDYHDNRGTAIQEATLGQQGMGYAIDYLGNEELAVWRHIPSLNCGLVEKIDMHEVRSNAFVVVKRFAVYGGIILLFAILIAILFSQYFISPLLSLKDTLHALSKGVLPDKVEKKYNDEVGRMAETTDEFVQALKRTAAFAEKIGQQELTADFKPLSKGDMLGNALINMRDNLIETEKRDKERNWIVSGVAELSNILRNHDTIDELGDAVIAYITEKIEAIQGAFYIVNDDNQQDFYIELKSTYAYHKKKYLQARFKFAEGLVGQAVAEQASVLRTEIPDDYVSITSGILGDRRPKCILITPLIANEIVYGVIEFAGFVRFTESQIKFVEEISLILARTIFNIKINERTRNLLEESQEMSNELQEQQEILRQNAEEMAATQEELKRTNQRLEDQIEEVNRTRNRMQLLLENASEVIAIYEEEGTIRYISPSVERILGYPQNDLIGLNDKVYVHPDGIGNFEQLFHDVLENSIQTATAQYEYIKKNGEAVWLEATATNMLGDPAIQGIIVNSRDITERRRAEREERMRSKMQALSENSPDLITRLTQDGEFFYINPIIESYTGQKPSDFLNKNLEDIDIEETIKNEWIQMLRTVEDRNETVAQEMDFPSSMGERVMQVNAIPEYDEEENIESVLFVSHDITERKQIELEIQSKNRKITESINYAKRIQSAILPNNAIIRQILPDSFILYKARDVVSGDFPWFINVGDTMYFAAVDCTGHGVPGALISLIGYFLLNDIVKGRKITDPGKILDALDKSVTKTLRQDIDNSQTKDGMDIALCKIEPHNAKVTYAGAHRPLYFMNKGELEEIKGDKFPIGGGIYKNQTKFTSTTIEVKKGDSIFFCSDGYPDQFGGPDNRKFGPKRLRDVIVDNHQRSMAELYTIFENAWLSWKGDQKQTDDILLIGVRF